MLSYSCQHSRFSQLLFYGITLVSTVITTQIATAETVMEKLARTGVLTAGTSKDALPFAYRNNEGQLEGYSIDMLRLIQQQLEKQLGRKIKLKLVALHPKDRINQLVNNNVDIVCDASSFTWDRDQKVDFSVSYGITGTRLLTKQEDYLDISQSLVSKRIGVLQGTTNELAMRRAEPKAEIVTLSDRVNGYTALEKGEIDAFAGDGILLESWLQTSNNSEDFIIAGYYSKEGIACMVPENNSQFLNNVNYALIRFMQGYLVERPQSLEIFDRWFGFQGILPLTEDLRALMIENMQLILDFKEEIPPKEL